MDRTIFLKIYNEALEKYEKYRKEITPKLDMKIIEKKEEELGYKISDGLKVFYHYYGNDSSVLNGEYYIFDTIDKVQIEKDALCFANTKKEHVRIGMLTEDTDLYPGIVFNWHNDDIWYSEYSTDILFLYSEACMNIIKSMAYSFEFNVKEKQFQSMLGESFELLTDNDLYMCSHNKVVISDDLLGCYCEIGSKLLIGTNKCPEILEQFKEKYELKSANEKPVRIKPVKKVSIADLNAEFEKLNVFRKTITEQMKKQEIEKKASELGVKFPESMISFYEFYGNDKEFLLSDAEMFTLKNITLDNGMICFGSLNQGTMRLGIKADDTSEDPEVFIQYEGEENWEHYEYTSSVFFYETAVWQLVMHMQGIAQAEITKRKLGAMIKKGSFDVVDTGKNAVYSTFISEKVLGIFINDEECNMLYVGTNEEDEVLEQFGKTYKIDLDWL